jgi:hypothetical protein
LDLDPDLCELSAEIARTRMRLRRARGPIPGLLQSDAAEAEPDHAAEASELERLREFVAQRRAAGVPLPPGGCGIADA